MKTETPRIDSACETCDDNRFAKTKVVNADFDRQIEYELNDLCKTAGIVADWLERSRQINPADMVSRNMDLAKELRMAAKPNVES